LTKLKPKSNGDKGRTYIATPRAKKFKQSQKVPKKSRYFRHPKRDTVKFCAGIDSFPQGSRILLQTHSSFITLFPNHSFYEKLNLLSQIQGYKIILWIFSSLITLFPDREEQYLLEILDLELFAVKTLVSILIDPSLTTGGLLDSCLV
jgi:hypothetical protein